MASMRGNTSGLLTLLTIVAVVAVLYFTSAVTTPLAVAILLSFLLAPLVIRLQRMGLGRIPAVIVVTVLSFAFLALIGSIVAGQLVQLAANLPQYKNNIRQKIAALQPSGGPLQRAVRGVREMGDEVFGPAPNEEAQLEPTPYFSDQPSQPEPVPVVVVGEAQTSDPTTTLGLIASTVGPLLDPLLSIGIVVVFVVFMLVLREDLRDRVIRLAGKGSLTVTTQAIDEAGQLVSRYLLMQLIVNATYGIPVMIGLYLIGLPNALLWGLLAIVLRYLPYIGPLIAAGMPIVLSLAVFDDWTRPALVLSLFIVLELISNNLIEPWLYGSGTGITAMAILVSAVFWTWLWGPIGLMLATPLTVCAMVIGRHVPQLGFLDVLLSDKPSLKPHERVYQRLLAGDQDEAFRIAAEYLQTHTQIELYDNVLVRALMKSERDRHVDQLDEERSQLVLQSMRSLIEELDEHVRLAQNQDEKSSSEAVPDALKPLTASTSEASSLPVLEQLQVLCIPARDEADELAAMMLVQLLRIENVQAEFVSSQLLSGEVISLIEQRKPQSICISATPPMAVTPTRRLCKQLASRIGKVPLIAAFWGVDSADLNQARQRIDSCAPAVFVGSFAQALGNLNVR